MSNLIGEKYTMKSLQCECYVDTVHNPDGSVNTSLRIRALPDKSLLFAYIPREGLVRINQKTGAIESKNILGELMSIRNRDNDRVIKFFQENGFLFPIATTELESFSFEDIFAILRRIRETLNLISLLHEARTRYKKIVSTICWLTLSPSVSINSLSGQHDGFKTCVHGYMKYIEMQRRGAYDNLTVNPYENDNLNVPDTVYPPYTSVSLSTVESLASTGGAGGHAINLDRYQSAIIYIHEKGETPESRKVIDFFYHLTAEFGSVKSDKGDIDDIQFDPKTTGKVSGQMQAAIIDVAKITIKEELDYAINAIFPSYDISTMTGTWVIPDLYSALLFSIFYIKPNLELYRECVNPNCGCYFLVSTTNSRRKYCCPECSNAVQQRRHRQRIKKSTPTEVDVEN